MKATPTDSIHINQWSTSKGWVVLLLMVFLNGFYSTAQVSVSTDTTTIAIGEQISYEISVETDSMNLVVFPEGQTFMPLELVESSAVDSIRQAERVKLLKRYLLTQFDSGAYTIPGQKVLIQDQAYYTDSIQVKVLGVEVDTTKQGLYDIKPLIETEKSRGSIGTVLLIILALLALAGFLMYWFIWRKNPLTEEEEIALLPPYEQAKYALSKLEQSQYLIRSQVKEFYSELTLILRNYLDQKVYDRALESTTDQLIARLQLLKEGNQIPLKKDTIKNIESILKRADLVKFAKSQPDMALAELDYKTIGKELDEVKDALPEPSEEEKMLDQRYREEQEQRKKQKKIILTLAISGVLMVATLVGLGIKYGFSYLFDTATGKESLELLEGEWVESAYGFPPVFIETPKVLKREVIEIPEELKETIFSSTNFRYISEKAGLYIEIGNLTYNLTQEEQEQMKDEQYRASKILESSENAIKSLERDGAMDIIVKRDQFITPNAAEGLKSFGNYNLKNDGDTIPMEYVVFTFNSENVYQTIILSWKENDDYLDQLSERVINSIELVPDAEEEEE
jgi:flagellar basal body-associated protein FliL